MNDENPNKTVDENKNTESAEREQNASDDNQDKALVDSSTESSSDASAESEAENISQEAQEKPAAKEKPKSRGWRTFFLVILVILFLVIIAITSAVSYISYENYKTLNSQNVSAQTQSEQVSDVQLSVDALSRTHALSENKARESHEAILARIQAAELRLEAQQKRILSMSTTSREDWLLAEAEYLLKLANQRVLVERKADSAVALFAEADVILRDLGDPKLFPLREEIKRDLIALKLAESIDVEGIYLELSALMSQVDSLPLVPQAFSVSEPEATPEATQEETTQARKSVFKFLDSFKGYFRVINHKEKPEAILPPDATAYLHLNLRFMLERAQLALLREQQNIYSESLKEAELWVKRYFPNGQVSNQYQQSLAALSTKNIVIVLPDVTKSLNLLKSYISDLHTLNPSLGSPSISEPETQGNTTNATNSATESNEAL